MPATISGFTCGVADGVIDIGIGSSTAAVDFVVVAAVYAGGAVVFIGAGGVLLILVLSLLFTV